MNPGWTLSTPKRFSDFPLALESVRLDPPRLEFILPYLAPLPRGFPPPWPRALRSLCSHLRCASCSVAWGGGAELNLPGRSRREPLGTDLGRRGAGCSWGLRYLTDSKANPRWEKALSEPKPGGSVGASAIPWAGSLGAGSPWAALSAGRGAAER